MTARGSTIVREVISSTSNGADVMSALPGLVRQMLDEEAWREFAIPGGQAVQHKSFGAFVQADPPKGLGGRKNQLIALCGTDEQLAARVRTLLLAEIPDEIAHGGDRHSDHFQVRDTNLKGDSSERVVARLKRDDPGLAEKVVRGEVTPNAAAREKGWRKPRIVLSTPERVAASLRKWMPRESLKRLAELLTQEESDTGQPEAATISGHDLAARVQEVYLERRANDD